MKCSVQSRALVVCLALVAGFSVLSARLIHLQWLHRSDWEATASRSYTGKRLLPADRGYILDRNEEIIARDLPTTSVVVDMYHLRDAKVAALGVAYTEVSKEDGWQEASAEERRRMVRGRRHRLIESSNGGDLLERHMDHLVAVLARPLGMLPDELRQEIEGSKKDEFVLKPGLNEDDADLLEELVLENRIQGLRFQKGSRRWYTSSELAVHAIGFVDHAGKGRCGVERIMTRHLTGKDGYRILKRDPRGFLLAANQGKLKPPVAGFHVQLTLDLGLQAIVEEELDAALVEYKAERAAVLMVEPKTGEVLAIASRPSFDLNVREHAVDAGFNFAIQAIFEPGSTIKVVATTAALDLGLANPGTQVFCHHGRLGEGRFSVPDHHPYGWLSFEEVLMKSSNIGTYKLAKQVGRNNFVDYLKRFGFTSKSGIAMSGEEEGTMVDPDNAVNFSRMSYGYGVSVTPLQLTMAYAAIANGGNLMKPRIVKSVIANDGTVVEDFGPEVRGRVMSEKTSERMRRALTKVVSTKGTASRAIVPGFLGAGKTGTVEKNRIGARGYDHDHYVVSFAGMLPADDPAFVCVVVIDDPLTNEVKRYGGTIAAPVYAKIAARTAAHMGLTPTEPIEGEEEILAARDD